MKKILLLTSLIVWLWIAEVPIYGQSLQGEWLTGSGGDYTVHDPIIQVDKDGNIYQAGSYTGATMNLGSVTLTGGPNGSAYVARFGTNGQVVWVQQFGTNGYANANDFHVDRDGTSRLVGSFDGTYLALNGDTLKKPAGVTAADYYLILDNSGNVQHFAYLVEPIDTSSYYLGNYAWDNQGNMGIAGINNWNGDTLAFGTLGLSVEKGNPTLFIAYFDPSGTPVWATSSRTTFGEYIQLMDPMISLDNNGDIVIAASYDGLAMVPVFGTDTLSFVQPGNFFLVKFDKNGNFSWATGSAGNAYPFLVNLVTDNHRNILLSGTFMSDTLSIGAMQYVNTSGMDDNFLVKLGPDGTLLWSHFIETENGGMKRKKSKGQAPFSMGNNIFYDSNDNVYLATWFQNASLVFNGDTLMNTGGSDKLIVKYLQDGTYSWAKNLPAWNSQIPSTTLDKNDILYVFSNLDISFTIDSATFTTDGLSTPAYVIGFDQNGTAIYGNTLTVPQYEYTSPYTIDSDGHFHLILSGTFSSSLQINNISVTASYLSNIFLARLAYLTRMTGTVTTGTAANPVTAGTVYLYKLLSSGKAPVEDSVSLQSDGSYLFKDYPYGNYLIYALSDTTVYPDAIGTYYGNESTWILADTVNITQDTLTSLDILVTQLTTLLNGNGTIEGVIEYDTSSLKSTASIMGEPVKKVKVILIGTEKSTQNVIAWVYTNDLGQYVFDNVPDGNYSIIVDIPGLPMDSTYTVTVTGNVISGLDFLVSQTEVLINTSSNVEVTETGPSGLKVWPNPSTGRFEVLLHRSDIESVTIFNNQGEVVRKVIPGNRVRQLQVDLSDQPAGIYYLRVTGNNTTGVIPVIIQR